MSTKNGKLNAFHSCRLLHITARIYFSKGTISSYQVQQHGSLTHKGHRGKRRLAVWISPKHQSCSNASGFNMDSANALVPWWFLWVSAIPQKGFVLCFYGPLYVCVSPL